MKSKFFENIKSKLLWMTAGSLITIILISCYTFLTSYDKNIYRMLGVSISYKHENFSGYLSSDICCYLDSSHGKKSIYFGELPPLEEAIEINAPDRATLYVFPSDEDSIIVRYEPRNGINRNYKISGFSNFNEILKSFYKLTDNVIFRTAP